MANKTKRQSKEGAQQFWSEHVNAWSNSGVTQAQYCREHNLYQAAFIQLTLLASSKAPGCTKATLCQPSLVAYSLLSSYIGVNDTVF